ncbi:hypothetical protein [Actinoplanes sp. NBRC 103695]|uniref:hypothetical protein n=1 Tax=Actinoplanes sp. NBRC 103695 TaxID=3032202 RepID=UPI0024A55E10|nr:hypothetical protein [Actinoplanes sp. NBRC 103695]GLY99134.1 hypothetical protein Acsp02_63880 [Actinoplanes sp. NBRC 103695]
MTAPEWDDVTKEMPVAGRKPDPLPSPELHSPLVRRLFFGGLAAVVAIAGVLIIASVNRAEPVPPRRALQAIDVVGGTAVVVRSADLGDDLYRARPAGRVSNEGGRIRLEVGAEPVELLLASGTAWDLTVRGAADRRTIDLAGARVSAVALADTATSLVLRLPRPDGTLAVRVTGGINQFALHAASGVPVRVRVGSGAGQVVLAGEAHNGVAAGALFTPDGWTGAGDRVDLDATAGLAQLSVTSG